jgi:hypothetical protein
MGCNCGKRPARAFVVSLPNGTTMTVDSEAQARAEITRAGGGKYKPKK